jgi:hypothetical protein
MEEDAGRMRQVPTTENIAKTRSRKFREQTKGKRPLEIQRPHRCGLLHRKLNLPALCPSWLHRYITRNGHNSECTIQESIGQNISQLPSLFIRQALR